MFSMMKTPVDDSHHTWLELSHPLADELAHMAESKAAKLEWLLLERLAPEPVLKNVQLGEEERAAQLEVRRRYN